MIGGYFEEIKNGFKISKDQFGEGNYKLYREDVTIKLVDQDNELAKVDINKFEEENFIERLNQELLNQIVDGKDQGVFLEVVGGSDSLKRFLRRLMNKDKFESN